jgi:endogenous inhibitor of DNA gyrase (YacG/DUF329 family)
MIKVRGPVCDREISGESPREFPHLPFCSDRCRLIDLGRWLGQGYRIPATDADLGGGDDDPDAGPAPPP